MKLESKCSIEWVDRLREPKVKPDPAWPKGKPLLLTDAVKKEYNHCAVELPYPARRCGVYVVRCERCGLSTGVTTAGRPDDPTTLEMLCGKDTLAFLRNKGVQPYVDNDAREIGPATIDSRGRVLR